MLEENAKGEKLDVLVDVNLVADLKEDHEANYSDMSFEDYVETVIRTALAQLHLERKAARDARRNAPGVRQARRARLGGVQKGTGHVRPIE